ncbi:MAG: hypothetical protein ACK4ZN_05770 [Oceanibaculum sp.]|jgi:hypothetical protein
MSKRSIPEIRAAEARQAEIVRELVAKELKRWRRDECQNIAGGFTHFAALRVKRR